MTLDWSWIGLRAVLKPRNRKQGELWVDTLENARETKIEPSRLERGIDKAKELLERVIELARDMGRGLGL